MLLLLCHAGFMFMPPQALAAGFMMMGGFCVEVLPRVLPAKRMQSPGSIPGEAIFWLLG